MSSTPPSIEPRDGDYDELLSEVAQILETARHTAARAPSTRF